jgi:malonyl-CoA O-methyltransferase
VNPLEPRAAYARWAASYDAENAVSSLDALGLGFLSPSVKRAALLDAGCGTGRRLVFAGENRPRRAAGVDLVYEMLAAGRRDPARPRTTAQADVRALPFSSAVFDLVWCRLVAGHVDHLGPLYGELARVLAPGGRAVVTDFHPAAARAGHTRTFRDGTGAPGAVAHAVHEPPAHEAAARDAGLQFDARVDLCIGDEVKPFYESAGALDRLATDRGLPLVLAFRFLK